MPMQSIIAAYIVAQNNVPHKTTPLLNKKEVSLQ